jgi:hypothetical protein
VSKADESDAAFSAGVLPDYIEETNLELRYTNVSEGFCKTLGYEQAGVAWKASSGHHSTTNE